MSFDFDLSSNKRSMPMKFADEIGFDFVNFTKDKKVEFFNVNDKDDYNEFLSFRETN